MNLSGSRTKLKKSVPNHYLRGRDNVSRYGNNARFGGVSSGRLSHEATSKTISRFQARAMLSNLFLSRAERRELKSNNKWTSDAK